jgi:hypothetical protein
MIELTPEHHDDVPFLDLVQRAVDAEAKRQRPREVYVIHLDNWFGDRWVQFSGKLVGMAGVRMKRLTVPPFHPNRVRSQRHYCWDVEANDYCATDDNRRLHRYQESRQNLRRYLTDIASSAMFVWYSGNTLANGAGSLMVYIVEGDVTDRWYVSFERTSEWGVKKCVGISVDRMVPFRSKHNAPTFDGA